MKKKLYCGAGKADYTPSMDMLPVTVFTPGNSRPLVGIIDHTFVRVILLSDGISKSVIVSYEMPAAPESDDQNAGVTPVVPMLAKYLGIPEDHVMALGTHAHSVPRVGNLQDDVSNEERKFDGIYSKQVYAATMEAVKQAEASLRPARVGVSRGKSYINVNRDQPYSVDGRTVDSVIEGANPEGPSDKTLFTLRFEDTAGNPIAFFVNYAVHGVVMMGNTLFKDGVGISSDLPGAVSRMIEEQYRSAVAVWSPGPAGDQNPIFMTMTCYPNPANGEFTYVYSHDSANLLLTIASRHFDDIMRTLAKIDHYRDDVTISCAHDWSITPGRLVVRENPKDNSSPVKEIITEGAPDVKIRLQLLRLGDIAIVGTSGEMYSSLGQHMRDASSLKDTCIASICGTRSPGYIPDDNALRNPRHHRALGANIQPGYLYDNLAKVTRGLFYL